MYIAEVYHDATSTIAKLIVRFVIDPWAGMLAVGALGHRLNLPVLFRFGFFEAALVVLIITAFSPMQILKWKITEKLGNS